MNERILVATNNQGKVHEFGEMFRDLELAWLSLADIGLTMDVEETGTTFLENATLKATAFARETGLLTLADDSGLEVDALDGAPGVYTARYGGPGLVAKDRYTLLLSNLTAVPPEMRTARFRCAIVVADGTGRVMAAAEGSCPGTIATEAAGGGGFGYDPVFYLPDYGQTMAQLPASTKHQISHRGRALVEIEPKLRAILAAQL